jgi:uncharacterized protein (TIGR03663 family)
MDFKAKIKHEWPAIAILALAAIARLTLLSIKPPHFDEGVNGWFVDQMTHTGFYHYDPTNYHGPLHFYILFLAQTLLGRHIWALRLPLVFAGIAAVYLTLKFDRFIGRNASRWAALAMAISPGCVFYSRYAIHEYWLVLSLMLCAWGIAGLWTDGARRYFWAIVFGVTGAVLTKETYFIHFGCALLTLPSVWLLGRLSPAPGSTPLPRQQWTIDRDILLGIAFFLFAVIFFYSGTFLDPASLKGLYQTYHAWAKTGATGNGHEKPWYYWLQLIGRYEWPTAIGLILASLWMSRFVRASILLIVGPMAVLTFRAAHFHVPIWDPKTPVAAQLLHLSPWYIPALIIAALSALIPEPKTPRVIRAIGIYGCGALAAYSIIPYKTPWCIVTLTWPFILLFGWAVDASIQKFRPNPPTPPTPASPTTDVPPMLIRSTAAGILLASAVYMVVLNFFRFTDAREPYVYVQTFPDVNKLMYPVYALVARNPANRDMTGHIILDSYHPLPWLLGDFRNIGYYNDDSTPQDMDADFLLVEETRVDDVEAALHDSYFTSPLHLRDAQDVSTLYLSVKKFAPIFPGRKPDFVPPRPQPATSPVPAVPQPSAK